MLFFIRSFPRFILGSIRVVLRGGKAYWMWIAFLLTLMGIGGATYLRQFHLGLIVTNMRDPVSWAFYIGNFTFLVGVAAAAVVLVIPAYVYNWKPIKEIVVIGELLAVSAIIMCLCFVMVDIGRPDRALHMVPPFGKLNVPVSMLSWDVIVLQTYLFLNLTIATHVVYRMYCKRSYSKRFALPLILFSIPAAVGIHTVTAFLYAGLPARPFWNTAILAPRFLASAFCSGPAIILILLQVLKRYAGLNIHKEALWKIAELMAYAMFINLFLFGAEVFREFYSGTSHLVHHQYLFFGLDGRAPIAAYAWLSLICSVVAFVLFLVPKTRKNVVLLNAGAIMIYIGVYVEKGVALVIPGFTPTNLGGIYEYAPSVSELLVSAAIFSFGFLLFTLMVKVAISIMNGQLNMDTPLGMGLISMGQSSEQTADAEGVA
jgi:Ni/Fe-hydrogenase subunit HybB-like protein